MEFFACVEIEIWTVERIIKPKCFIVHGTTVSPSAPPESLDLHSAFKGSTIDNITAMDRGGQPTRRSRRWQQRLENRLMQLMKSYERGDKCLDEYWNTVSYRYLPFWCITTDTLHLLTC